MAIECVNLKTNLAEACSTKCPGIECKITADYRHMATLNTVTSFLPALHFVRFNLSSPVNTARKISSFQ